MTSQFNLSSSLSTKTETETEIASEIIKDEIKEQEQLNQSAFGIEDTFYNLLSIKVNHDISSMSMSPASRDVALGSREGLYIVDLQNPYDPPRFLPHSSGHRPPIDLQWSPHPCRSEWVVSTSNQKAVIYNLTPSSHHLQSPIEHTLAAHTRAITDINWSPHHSDILTTCALDGWIWEWDLRTGGRKPVWGVSSWGSGATQVKYNRREEHVVASAHDKRVFIWDDRMGAVPVTIIAGHSAKIYGIDWSRRDPKMLITCSLDKSFKSWHLSNPSTPDLTVHTSTPIYRARYLPFGRGALTLPQRGDHALSIWGREKIARGDTAQPVARFEGAREGVKEFVWRTRGGRREECDDREFQLVTWSKDRRLRLWPVSEEILKEVGHVKGSKIEIQMTRRNCPNISYRTLEVHLPPPFSLNSTSPSFSPLFTSRPLGTLSQPSNLSQVIQASPLGGPSLLTSSLATATANATSTTNNHNNTSGLPPNATLAYTNPNSIIRGSATMTTNNQSTNLSRIQNALDRLNWMEGVKLHTHTSLNLAGIGGGAGGDMEMIDGMNSTMVSPEASKYPSDAEGGPIDGEFARVESRGGGENDGQESITTTHNSTTNTTTTTSTTTRGRRELSENSPIIMTGGGGIETRSSSLQRGTDGGGTAREGGETERAESILMSGSRTTAQNHHGHHHGSGLKGSGVGGVRELNHKNLGEEVTSVVRRFPRVNFEKVHVAGRTCTVSLYTPVFVRATFTFPKSYPHSSPPTIELERNADITLKSRAFLLQSLRKLMASRAQMGLPSLEFALRFLLGERGDLLEIGNGTLTGLGKGSLVVDDEDDDEGEEGIRAGLGNGSQTLGRNINVPPPRRGGAIFGPRGQLIVFFPTNVFVSPTYNEKEEHPESTPLKNRYSIRVSEAFGNITGDRDSPTEDEYQETDEALQISTGISFRLSGHTHPRRSLNTSSSAVAAPSFSTTVHIKDISHLTLLQPDRICNFLDRPPLEVAHSALDNAVDNRDALLVQLWSTITCFLEHSQDSAFGLSRQFETVLAERLLPELLSYFTHLRDIQTLGVVACLLEVYRRALANAAHPSISLPDVPPSLDYFSPRTESTPAPYNEKYDATTPQPRHQNPLFSPSDSSPKASWTNLGALFNNSVLSLRGGTPPTPGTLEKMYPGGIIRPQYSASLSSPRISKISPRIRKESNSPLEGRRSGNGSGSGGSGSGGGSVSATRDRNQVERGESFFRNKKPSLERQQSQFRPVKESPMVTFGDTSTIVGKNKNREVAAGGGRRRVVVRYKDPSTIHAPVHWWLTDRAQTELELIRLAYAELLYRWGFDNDRIEVLKLCRSSSFKGVNNKYGATLLRAGNGFDKQYGVDLTRSCGKCKAALHAPYLSCSACHTRQTAVLCVICRLPVLKLSQNCTICCHVGHVECLQRWYSIEEECSTGCGCNCVKSGGLEGIFIAEVAEVKIKVVPASVVKPKWGSFRNSLPNFM